LLNLVFLVLSIKQRIPVGYTSDTEFSNVQEWGWLNPTGGAFSSVADLAKVTRKKLTFFLVLMKKRNNEGNAEKIRKPLEKRIHVLLLYDQSRSCSLCSVDELSRSRFVYVFC